MRCSEIAAKSLTSYETTVAFCKRAAIAHQLVHCLTDLFVQDALKRAQELDEYLQTNGVSGALDISGSV